MIGSTEIIVIAAVILVLFGASAIPRFMRSLGKAKSEFEKGIKEGMKESEEDKAEKKNEDSSSKK
jgi:sec-independent protein translocase protein TatA